MDCSCKFTLFISAFVWEITVLMQCQQHSGRWILCIWVELSKSYLVMLQFSFCAYIISCNHWYQQSSKNLPKDKSKCRGRNLKFKRLSVYFKKEQNFIKSFLTILLGKTYLKSMVFVVIVALEKDGTTLWHLVMFGTDMLAIVNHVWQKTSTTSYQTLENNTSFEYPFVLIHIAI